MLLANSLNFMVILLLMSIYTVWFCHICFQLFIWLQFLFYASIGEGMGKLSLADRATIANMSPEYGATMGFFPVDHVTLQYLKLTGRSDETVRFLL